ncbi:MAG: hydantoinase B/oxoprolinase family protein [Cytophagia bacterium]|nr:MAG: hydantoinase B/oxoprolinase family protein [Runella sp.]TAG23757.1 MAG: hydantoinase B/oxoprolinase family protein [Cytophagales bacterium]TAG43118.1 MAG: hydantoinase B/oxoprolinase family protein [Cytophagia bacterium]TAG74473.1 MAG: hydantoinase B/oxoprolinase family protein [Runella slithyformis]TAG76520.1 MAG: hydantoinase B/oxoprolinase family protein [Cytophagales bacterium]
MNPEKYDPISLSILWARLLAIVDEAGTTLQRTSFSTVTRESNDFAVVLMDAQGRSIAQSSTSVPSFLGVLPMLTQSLLRDYFPLDTWQDGDVVITNDPWLCAGHKPDIGIVSPIFRKKIPSPSKGEGRGEVEKMALIGFVGTIAHSPDMGGVLWGAGARDLYEEGLMIPPTKLYEAGKPNQWLFNLIEANVRASRQTLGDIRAQVASNEQGIRSLMRMMDENNMDSLHALAEQVIDASEKAMREAISKAPNGTYRYDYDADGDGLHEPVHIKCAVTIKDDEIEVDYEGTSGAHSLAINAVKNYVFAYTAYPIKCAFSPEVPNNEGAFRPIKVNAPVGSLLNAQKPVPLGGRNITGNILHAPVFGALAQAVPLQVQADCGSACWCLVLNGQKDIMLQTPNGPKKNQTDFVEYFFLNGGYAARPHMDGINVLSFPTNVANVPIEVLERDAPIMVTEKSLRPNTGGAGKYRGGLGQTFAFKMMGKESINFSILTEKTKTVPHGICGGQNGSGGSFSINPDRFLPPKGLTKLHFGEEVRLHLPGGGGYGNPTERNPEAIAKDQELGYIS